MSRKLSDAQLSDKNIHFLSEATAVLLEKYISPSHFFHSMNLVAGLCCSLASVVRAAGWSSGRWSDGHYSNGRSRGSSGHCSSTVTGGTHGGSHHGGAHSHDAGGGLGDCWTGAGDHCDRGSTRSGHHGRAVVAAVAAVGLASMADVHGGSHHHHGGEAGNAEDLHCRCVGDEGT